VTELEQQLLSVQVEIGTKDLSRLLLLPPLLPKLDLFLLSLLSYSSRIVTAMATQAFNDDFTHSYQGNCYFVTVDPQFDDQASPSPLPPHLPL
jgi:hypothetical protein